MRKVFIKVGFAGESIDGLSRRRKKVVTAMTGNAVYVELQPDVLELGAKGKQLDELNTEIDLGNNTLTAERDQVEAIVVGLLMTIGLRVMVMADGDIVKLKSSGYELYKEKTPAPAVTAPDGLKLTDGTFSGLKAKIKAVLSAVIYTYEWTDQPVTDETVWQRKQAKYVSCTITGLTSGQRYWVRVGAVDKDGNVVYCDPVSRIVQ